MTDNEFMQREIEQTRDLMKITLSENQGDRLHPG